MIFFDKVDDRILADYERIFQIPITDERMNDRRREIHEEAHPEDQSSIGAFLVHDDTFPLGQHYHKKKTEVFFITSGMLTRLLFADELGGDVRMLENLPAGTQIVMPPGITHTFFLAPGSRMVCYSSELFDQADMITVKIWPLEAPVESEISRRAPRH